MANYTNIDDVVKTGKKYQIIYADPPWSYKTWTAKGGHKSASAHYQTMEKKDIQEMPIKEIADNDCTLFLWVTMPNLIEGIELIEKWGFTYKTCAFDWVKIYKSGKPVVGLGYWTRANAELCLLATKGKPKRINNSVSQIVIEQPREHSRKPDCVRDRIVQLMGDLPRIELFCRHPEQGWDSMGNELTEEKINGQ